MPFGPPVGDYYQQIYEPAIRKAGLRPATDRNMQFHDKLYYPERLLRQKIRNRSPYISLHGTDELDRNPAMGGKTVYTFMPPKRKNVK